MHAKYVTKMMFIDKLLFLKCWLPCRMYSVCVLNSWKYSIRFCYKKSWQSNIHTSFTSETLYTIYSGIYPWLPSSTHRLNQHNNQYKCTLYYKDCDLNSNTWSAIEFELLHYSYSMDEKQWMKERVHETRQDLIAITKRLRSFLFV